jgi:hypothetical protein
MPVSDKGYAADLSRTERINCGRRVSASSDAGEMRRPRGRGRRLHNGWRGDGNGHRRRARVAIAQLAWTRDECATSSSLSAVYFDLKDPGQRRGQRMEERQR